MTKEELEKEAYRWTEKNISVGISMYNPNIVMYCRKAYKDSAEPREKQIQTLGERSNQLLKDKGDLTDKIQELKEILAQTIENDEVAYETLKLHDQEEIGMLNSKITKLEQQIEKCRVCCWYYTSSFETEIDDNSCATCRHKAKMLTDKKPCKDCDNGCNWEK